MWRDNTYSTAMSDYQKNDNVLICYYGISQVKCRLVYKKSTTDVCVTLPLILEQDRGYPHISGQN